MIGALSLAADMPGRMPADGMIGRAFAETEVLEINAGKRPVTRGFTDIHPEGVKSKAMG